MVLPDAGVLAAALVCGAFGAAIVLLVIGLRGVPVRPGRPPTRWTRWGQLLRSPAMTSRVAAGLVVAVLTVAITRWPVAAVGLGALVVLWPQMFGGTRHEQAGIAKLEALVIWTESLRDTIAAHASLEQAIPATTNSAAPIIRGALVRLGGQIQARLPLEKALLGLATELDDPSADLVIAALILNVRRRGDRLGEVLSGLAAAAREELDIRRRISAGRTGLRRGVQIVVIMTIAFAVFLVLFGGAYVRPYDTAAGQVALAVVLGMFGAGFVWMRKLAGATPVLPFLARPGLRLSRDDARVVTELTGVSSAAAEALARGSAASSSGGVRS